MSSASDTIASQLNQNIPSQMDASVCAVHVMRFMFWFSIFLITLSSLSSLLSHSMTRSMKREMDYDTLTYKRPMMLNKRQQKNCLPIVEYMNNEEGIENFENTEYLSYSNSNTFNVQSVPLTSPLNKSTHEYSNLTFGQAIRHTIIDDKQQKIVYNITTNLYVINGNIYDQAMDNLPQSYTVHLLDDTNTVILGELKKDGDGVYKLRVESSDLSLQNLKHIKIIYYRGDESQVMLEGKFK